MIVDNIQKLITDALKGKDEIRLSTLRLLSAELHNSEIAKIGKLTEEEELAVVRKEVKKRKDAIEAYEKAGRIVKADTEKKELSILQEFLPTELSDEELESIVAESISALSANSIADLGRVIGQVMGKTQGRADGSKVASVVRSHLSR
jgi:uncharacterized protein YqeY